MGSALGRLCFLQRSTVVRQSQTGPAAAGAAGRCAEAPEDEMEIIDVILPRVGTKV